MAHNLEQFTDGTAAFFSNRQVPWHNLGTITSGALTADEALSVAQLDWKVFKSSDPVQVPGRAQGVQMISVPDKFAVYRDHPKLGLQGLGVVGSQYEVIQNSEAFEFLNFVCDESGAVFETAGSLNGGRQVFMSMRMPEGIVIGDGQDSVDLYLMATSSHDGTKAFTVAVTPIRPVCANTVRLALREAKSQFYVKHTQKVQGKIHQAREALGIAWEYRSAYKDAVDGLAAASFTDKQFDAFLASLIKDDVKTDRQRKNVESVKDEMRGLWKATTQANIANTRWAAYNTVAEWADWAKPIKAKGQDPMAVRAERIMLGGVDLLKDKAYALLAV